YPEELPVSAHRGEIIAALERHAVVVVSGDTGSGKTTQLPKMALEAGCGARGRRIAVTQPRRLAAMTMAARVAEELGCRVGGAVGFQHRFGKQISKDTRVKFLTDGVLLAETRGDPLLRAYDMVIVDEAHERSLNVDFLLGVLKRALAKRRDLKVVVSSATMDVRRFSDFFGGAPVVSVPGRLFPIEVRHRPPPDGEERDLPREVADALAELPPRDDVLVFLPGERDIRETAAELEGRFGAANDVIPLLASLPAGEQRRAFRPSTRRRVVLATNVAETSVTIPGIRAVIDSGLARISRYVHRTQVQRLQIEPISQASARQRMGRCGRLGPGTCIRLYSEEDLAARDAYTPPEVLRSSLAGVILAMLDLRLGDVADFPFIDPPKAAMIHEGFRELLELGAVTRDAAREPALTDRGRVLAKMPVEPRLARMLIAAAEKAVLPSVLPVVAALACDDPKRRPIDEREKADQAHAAFRVPGSDFLGTLKLWTWWDASTRDLSQSKARALAKKTYLSYPKMREWRDLARQLGDLAKRLGLSDAERRGDEEDFRARFHQALLSGLLSRIGRYDEEERDYRGAHGLRFALHPGSVLAKRTKRPSREEIRRMKARGETPPKPDAKPPWIVAGELVDTARLYARDAAEIDVDWIEPIAGDLCRRTYRAPEWDAQSGFARVTEQVVLHGLVIVPSRRRDLARVDPKLAREIFIQDGLVGCALPHPAPAVRAVFAVIAALRRRAEKLRKPEAFDAEGVAAHFDAVLPPDVASGAALDKWLRRARPDELARFKLKEEDWLVAIDERADFPDRVRIEGATFALSYRHEPDDPEKDGITCTVRRRDVRALRSWQSDWLVPGALPEKIGWMLRTLPNAPRRALMPLDDKIAHLAGALKPGAEPLADAVRRETCARWGVRIPADAWANAAVPPHLRVRFVVKDDATGRVLLATRDKREVFARFDPPDGGAAGQSAAALSCTWNFGTVPAVTEGDHGGWTVKLHPALKDEGGGVALRSYPDEALAARIHAQGVTRLLTFALARDFRMPLRAKDLDFEAARHLKEMDYETAQFADDVFEGAVRAALVAGREPVRDERAFVARAGERDALMAAQGEIRALALDAVARTARLVTRSEADERIPADVAEAVQNQLVWLVFRGFPARVAPERLQHYPRYLKGAALRLERAANAPASDRAKEALLKPHWTRYVAAVTGPDRAKCDAKALDDYRWLVEEYRISLFAQELHTAQTASPKRLDALWQEATASSRSSSI
ncbi:MAG: ATP-dependent RNA helicase HrpA, partial [Kiritimatiellae bacterium]|nr:ATP-dependent RNA helicase HrpA [Kiritimatiellia bacterium]